MSTIDEHRIEWRRDHIRDENFRVLQNRQLQENECEDTLGFPEGGVPSKSDCTAMSDSESGMTPLYLATQSNSIRLIELLVDRTCSTEIHKENNRRNMLWRTTAILELCAAGVIAEMHQMRMLKNMKSMICLFMLLSGLTQPALAQTRHFECSLEQKDDKEFCIFRNVRLQRNEVAVTFGFPGNTAPSNVAFEMSNMATLPANFWNTFGENLQILQAESCGLRSITITNKMEVLNARNNTIKALTVQQDCNLIELDMSRNILGNGQSIAKCNKLKILNVNDNENFASDGVLDLAMFKTLVNLEQLYLSSVGVIYMENSKNVGLPLLHIIDLSRNRIIPSDLSIEIFVPFTGLETLKLNNNAMGRLDYRQLRDIKALKAVYLNGNSFKCDYLVDMLAILHELNIETPTDRFGSCQPNDREVKGMCCLPSGSPPPPPPPPTPPPTTVPPTSPPSPTPPAAITTSTTSPAPEDQDGDSSNTMLIIGLVVAAIVAIVAAIAAIFIVRSKRQRQMSLDQRELDRL